MESVGLKRSEMPGFFGGGRRLGYFVLGDDNIPKNEQVDVRCQKAAQSVLGSANNRFTADVEAGIDEHGAAGLSLENFQQVIKAAMALLVDSLNACAVIDVRDGGDGRTRDVNAVTQVEGAGHRFALLWSERSSMLFQD